MSAICSVCCSFRGGVPLGCWRCVLCDTYIDTSVGERWWWLISHILSLSVEEPISELFDQELKQTMHYNCLKSLKWRLWGGIQSRLIQSTGHQFAEQATYTIAIRKERTCRWQNLGHISLQMKSHQSFLQSLQYTFFRPHFHFGTGQIYFISSLSIHFFYQVVSRLDAVSLENYLPVTSPRTFYSSIVSLLFPKAKGLQTKTQIQMLCLRKTKHLYSWITIINVKS